MPRPVVLVKFAIFYHFFLKGSLAAPHLPTSGSSNGVFISSSLVEISHEQRTFLIRALTTVEFPQGTKPCEVPEHCDAKLRCDSTTKLCTAKESPEFPVLMENVTCEDNRGCPFLYRCYNSICEYTLFKACRTKLDCFQNLGLEYDCRERSEQMPGKQCYRKCQIERDCYDCNGSKCRFPEMFQKIISCCDGYCSKKISCDDR